MAAPAAGGGELDCGAQGVVSACGQTHVKNYASKRPLAGDCLASWPPRLGALGGSSEAKHLGCRQAAGARRAVGGHVGTAGRQTGRPISSTTASGRAARILVTTSRAARCRWASLTTTIT